MKSDRHPTYHQDATVVCACGNTFVTGSTQRELRVEVCSNCHPFYTGKQKFVDSARRVDRFKRLMERKATAPKQKKAVRRTARKAAKAEQ